MALASIPVDLTNPGQVFGCIGLAEAADQFLGQAEGAFDWDGPECVRFRLSSASSENPVRFVLSFLKSARVRMLVPVDTTVELKKNWKFKATNVDSRTFPCPFPDPRKPAKLPAQLFDDCGRTIDLEYWGDETRKRDNVKFWAGAGGYPGAALASDALNLARDHIDSFMSDPFSLSAQHSSSFRLDWRRDYVPIDAGFSLNRHQHIVTQGYPLVELLAAIGLSHARPVRHEKLRYSYGVAGYSRIGLYDLVFLRAALGSCEPIFPGMPFRRYQMQLDWPGQENQARCITNVVEESIQT